MEFSKEKKYGWKIPLGVNPKTGEIEGTDLETDIKEAVIILLNTRPGERLGHPDYGCNLMRFAFENITYSMIKEIKDEIMNRLTLWEDRIKNIVINVLKHSSGREGLIFEIQYEVKETGRLDEVLYEFTNTR